MFKHLGWVEYTRLINSITCTYGRYLQQSASSCNSPSDMNSMGSTSGPHDNNVKSGNNPWISYSKRVDDWGGGCSGSQDCIQLDTTLVEVEMSCVAYTHVGKGILLLYSWHGVGTRFCHSVMLRSMTMLWVPPCLASIC